MVRYIAILCLFVVVTTYPTTYSPFTTTTECRKDDSKVERCYAFYCGNGQWQRFEFTATYECCKTSDHPKCLMFGYTQAPPVG
ncbi:Hypothetical predicted protein [Mytilus galloprovincialis]|uniref:Uncharacterized protein n=1 Tax=Mytilus galloprovincialis TaxID=29158 RepID=A0A8B6HSH4_MYTGA|nr:Hypothetical predicted protein [Mytilus galloprovincialis]